MQTNSYIRLLINKRTFLAMPKPIAQIRDDVTQGARLTISGEASVKVTLKMDQERIHRQNLCGESKRFLRGQRLNFGEVGTAYVTMHIVK